MKPLSKVDTQWSPELAYAVGLIVTDGCLSKDGRHIDFTSKDRCLIETFRKCLGLKNKIGLKSSGRSNKKYFRVQFGDINFYKWLESIGLSSRKSKTIEKIDIPDKFFMDFLRGHFDGDGYFYSYWDRRWPNSFMFYANLVSSSPPHLYWLRKRVNKLLEIKGHITAGGKGVQLLRFAKKESGLLLSKMYYKQNIPCLLRKRRKVAKHISLP